MAFTWAGGETAFIIYSQRVPSDIIIIIIKCAKTNTIITRCTFLIKLKNENDNNNIIYINIYIYG